jgi:hypothetical protein
MGLDGVELVMSIEEGFGVTIADAEAEACVTPAAVIDLVFGKLRASDERVCISQRACFLQRFLRELEQQPEGVPVASDSVRAGTTLLDESVREVGLQ